MTLFSGLGTDVHFSGDETGLQWEDYLFEMQNAVEWRMVMSRGQDERSQMHAMSLLLNTCSGMTNRVLIDDGARWILQGDEQEREPDNWCSQTLTHRRHPEEEGVEQCDDSPSNSSARAEPRSGLRRARRERPTHDAGPLAANHSPFSQAAHR